MLNIIVALKTFFAAVIFQGSLISHFFFKLSTTVSSS